MSDEQIINQQAASLASKDNYQTNDSYNPRNTVTSEESNVNESGVEGFAGAEVSIGRTGQTGGGTNAQIIPPEEGGLDSTTVQGESSDRFEGPGGVEESRREVRIFASLLYLNTIIQLLPPLLQRLANNPGGYDTNPRGIDEKADTSKNETIPLTTGQELQPGQGLTYDQAPQ